MAFTFSGLTTYTKQNIKPLMTSAVLGAKTQELIKSGGMIITGVKSSCQLPIMDTDAIFQTDNTCSYDPSGSTQWSQRQLSVGKIKIEETLCPKDLEQYFLQEMLRSGSTYTDLGNPELTKAYLDKKNARIAAQLETALWQGDTASGNVNLNKFDGLGKIITAAGASVTDANVAAYNGTAGPITAVTQSNVIASTEAVYKAIPAQVLSKGDVKIFVGDDWYRLLIMAYRGANLFAYNPQDSQSKSFIIPGTATEITAVNGLNGTGDAYGISLSNMALGLDLQDEEMNYKLWWSEDNNQIRFRCAFKMGIQVALPSEVTKFMSTI